MEDSDNSRIALESEQLRQQRVLSAEFGRLWVLLDRGCQELLSSHPDREDAQAYIRHAQKSLVEKQKAAWEQLAQIHAAELEDLQIHQILCEFTLEDLHEFCIGISE